MSESPWPNNTVATALRRIAGTLEQEGSNPFRARAYRRAADTIDGLPEDVAELSRQGRLEELRGIGRELAKKISRFLETGEITTESLAPPPRGAASDPFLKIPRMTPAAARVLRRKLGIESDEDLLRLARSRLLRTIPELGLELEQAILFFFENICVATETIPDSGARKPESIH